MATNAENLTLAMLRLGSRSSTQLRAQLLLELNKTIRELERGPTRPWFMESRLEGSLTANQDYIALPATFLDELEEGVFRLYNTECEKWKPLYKKDYDQVQYKSENCDAAFPEYYALHGERMYFAATPDAAYNYRWEAYVRTDAVVDNASETTNKWLIEYYDLVTLMALDKVARLHIRASQVVADIAAPLAKAQDDFWRSVEARQQINRDYEQE